MKKTEELKRIKNMKDTEILAEIAKARKEIAVKSLSVKAGKSSNHAQISDNKKKLARLLTIKNASAE
ncbi:MAG: 50S ribosomal protein L29 [Patescibacteria group bacterium]|jgi:ribosomal protein L29